MLKSVFLVIIYYRKYKSTKAHRELSCEPFSIDPHSVRWIPLSG